MEQHLQDAEPIAPLVGLVERLRVEATEPQEAWEELGSGGGTAEAPFPATAEERLAPLVGLMERLRQHLDQMQKYSILESPIQVRELEAEQERLWLVEATVELMQWPQEEIAPVSHEEGAEGGVQPFGEDCTSQAVQASVSEMSSLRHVQCLTRSFDR
jgi:hypothetical protein